MRLCGIYSAQTSHSHQAVLLLNEHIYDKKYSCYTVHSPAFNGHHSFLQFNLWSIRRQIYLQHWKYLLHIPRIQHNNICLYFLVTQVKKKEWKGKLLSQASNLGPVTGSPVHQAPSYYPGQKPVSPFFLICYQWLLTIQSTSHWQTTLILCHQNPFRGQPVTPLHQGRSQDGGILLRCSIWHRHLVMDK